VTFATIARTRSFTRAAAELGLSSSALSHAIRGLEVRLLARTTRSVAPTSAGERLPRSLQPALKAVETGLEALNDWRGEPSGSIRITTAQGGARNVLAPALPQFLLDHPRITVEICVGDPGEDLVAAAFVRRRFESQLSRMNCQMFSSGLSSGHLAGSGIRVMLEGIFKPPERCHPA
jgi:DNA-binding transcriptional LysR family regulator